ncbi:MAG: hypothetical protein JWR10_3170 [Rubritepida sp.]|nr:hypothetical protein [Rubritepida sp.]
MRAADRAAEELRHLVAALERSGMADRRADVRALLENSRSLLQARRRAGPVPMQARAVPSARKVAGKLGTVAGLATDALVLAAFLWGMWSVLTHQGPITEAMMRIEVAAALCAPAWMLARLKGAADWLYECSFVALYYAGWVYDWFAEAFSRKAMDRLTARLEARDVMWAWHQHRHSLLHRPSLPDVESFLAMAYGAQAARAFRRAADVMSPGEARSRAGQRLASLRWSALIRLFEGLAGSGALWPEPEMALPVEAPPSPQPPPQPPEPSPEPQAEPPERAQRRIDLREVIRKKRQDITTAYGWKLKTAAEIDQRDLYLRQTRVEITTLEKELAGLGG